MGEPDGLAEVNGDPLFGSKFLRELYFRVDPDYSGRFTVPVLWDKQTNTIVNNESSEIIRMLNTEFNHLLPDEYAKLDLYPENLRAEIDDQNDWVYNTVNNGVYKSGFATKQDAYESNVVPLFESLDRLEKMLDGGKKFIAGDQLTEADVRLFTTIVCSVLQSFAAVSFGLSLSTNLFVPLFPDPLRPVSKRLPRELARLSAKKGWLTLTRLLSTTAGSTSATSSVTSARSGTTTPT